jgi:hypothetical protein
LDVPYGVAAGEAYVEGPELIAGAALMLGWTAGAPAGVDVGVGVVIPYGVGIG